jgi:hypothetical protein
MIYIKAFNTNNEEDFLFSYEILKKRYSNNTSLIEGITPQSIPSYEEHKVNILKKFKILRVGFIYEYKIGLGYIDNKNFVGFFYDLQNLKKAIKTYRIKDFDFSSFFLKEILALGNKDEPLFAHVGINNKLANNTASRLMKQIANTYIYYP